MPNHFDRTFDSKLNIDFHSNINAIIESGDPNQSTGVKNKIPLKQNSQDEFAKKERMRG